MLSSLLAGLIYTTSRQLDREYKAEHILEVSDDTVAVSLSYLEVGSLKSSRYFSLQIRALQGGVGDGVGERRGGGRLVPSVSNYSKR